MRRFLIDDSRENIEEEINNDFNFINHSFYGLIYPENRYDLVRNLRSRVTLNAYNFIAAQYIEHFNYQNESSSEPTISEVTYRYSAYRMVSEQISGHTYEYRWTDGNIVPS